MSRPAGILALAALGLAMSAGWRHPRSRSIEPGPKQIVFVTGDEEYRSEESMPMLAALLEQDFGYAVNVCYSLDDDGFIDPNRADHIAGLEALADADLMVLFTRFRALPDEELRWILDFAESGRPIVGFRTATHPFRYPDGHPRAAALNEKWPREVFGQCWITHHGHLGDNEQTLTRAAPAEARRDHPILRGVTPFEAFSWLYHVEGGGDSLFGDCDVLCFGESLVSIHDRQGRADRFPIRQPIAWTKTGALGEHGGARVFFTTLGHPYDFLDRNMRRLAIHGILWALGDEDRIPGGGVEANTVSPYAPSASGFGDVFKKGRTPNADAPIIGHAPRADP